MKAFFLVNEATLQLIKMVKKIDKLLKIKKMLSGILSWYYTQGIVIW